ncbi:hypothetical protein LXL04_029398 [Taraxacum kok-saghyz]
MVITGSNIGHRTFIFRLSLIPSDKKVPFRFKRSQFPISVCFAMIINKSQGQSLSSVGLFLREPVFTHSQLYVALSRVKSRQGLKLVILDKDDNLAKNTTNVVYNEFIASSSSLNIDEATVLVDYPDNTKSGAGGFGLKHKFLSAQETHAEHGYPLSSKFGSNSQTIIVANTLHEVVRKTRMPKYRNT